MKRKPQSTKKTRSIAARNAPVDATLVPSGYPALLAEIKARIRGAQIRASLAASHEMLVLYWDLGRTILARQTGEGWGAKVIDRLSGDLRSAFPEHTGFSARNLKYMRAFAAAWPDSEIVQRIVAQLPWRHLIALLEKLAELTCAVAGPRIDRELIYLCLFEYYGKTRAYARNRCSTLACRCA